MSAAMSDPKRVQPIAALCPTVRDRLSKWFKNGTEEEKNTKINQTAQDLNTCVEKMYKELEKDLTKNAKAEFRPKEFTYIKDIEALEEMVVEELRSKEVHGKITASHSYKKKGSISVEVCEITITR